LCENGEIKWGYIHRHVACMGEINILFGKPHYGLTGFKGAECEVPNCVRLAWDKISYGLL